MIVVAVNTGGKEALMPLYMVEFGYTPEVWTGLIKSPENREETVRRILEDAGCKLHNLWYAFGENDGFALIEAPDNTTAGAIALTITSSGAFRKFETHVLMTQNELLDALEKAGDIAYTAPGAAVHA
jgi:uncharacterized protein with GYD domain